MILLVMLLCLKTFLMLKMFERGIWSEKLLINRDIRKLNLRLILNSEERRNTLHWFRKYYIDFLTLQMTFSNHLKNIINQVRQNPWFPDSENNFVLLPWTHSFPYVQINKVNRCLARYSPHATTTNRPTNRALNKPAWPGPNWPKMPILGQIWSFLGNLGQAMQAY